MNAVKFPDMIRYNKTQIIEGKAATAQNLECLLLSYKKTLLGDPYFGSNLQRLLFESNNLILRDIIIDEVFTTINAFMPQIRVLRKDIKVVKQQDNKLVLNIKAQNLLDYSFGEYSINLLNSEEL